MSEEAARSTPETEIKEAENSVEIVTKLTSEDSVNNTDHNVEQQITLEEETESNCDPIRPNHSRVSKGLSCLYNIRTTETHVTMANVIVFKRLGS